MKKGRKQIAFLAALLLLSVLLAACGSNKCSLCGKSFRGEGHSTSMGILCDDCYNSVSGLGTASTSSNTGVWIAITVMVFVAVFAATSGIVYLVLQKLLPPGTSKPQDTRVGGTRNNSNAARPAANSYSAPRPQPRSSASMKNEETLIMPRPRPQPPRTATPNPYGGEWVCPRDRSRNSGPYCSVCGAPRPQAPKSANSARQVRPQQPQPQQPQRPAVYPQAQPPVQSAAAPKQSQRPQFDFDAAEINTSARTEAAPTYTGKFAKKAEPAPVEQQPEAAQEPEYDAELLAAIFREAEQGDGQE